MIRRRPEPHILAGAYVLDALDAANLSRFRRHLARCPECASEVAGLREVAGRLAAASAARPPARLKEQLLARTERTRQLPPVVGRTTGDRWRLRRPARAPGLALALAGITAVAVMAIWLSWRPAQHIPARHIPARPAPARHVPAGQRLADPAIVAILTAPDAVMMDAPVRHSGHATVVMSLRERTLVFAAAGLPALPPTRCYELWLMGGGRDRPAGLLPMPRHGMAGPVIAAGLHRGERLGLSIEPASGSRHPTSAMLLVLAL